MASKAQSDAVRIELLGGFRVRIGSDEVPGSSWPGRRPAELVQLLALADGHRMTRDAAIDALWPRLDPEAGAANLRKAAHHARSALGDPDAVVLRGGQVTLFPSRPVDTDAEEFESRARGALSSAEPDACASAASAYPGDLLPDSLYEDWTQAPREDLRSTHLELLRRGRRWERLAEVEPTDEEACCELMRSALEGGSRPAAIRWYGRLRTALRRDLGLAPSAETRAVYDECVEGLGAARTTHLGRQLELATATARLRSGVGGELIVRGPAGIGKSAFCAEVAEIARAEGSAVVSVVASESEGPYGPIAGAIEQLIAGDRGLVEKFTGRARSVLTELSSLVAPAAALGRPVTRQEVIGAFRRLLEATGEGRQVLLVVDDAHLADEATVDLLLHLGSAGATPIVVLLAYRAEPASDALTQGVARLTRAGTAAAIDLEPLDREDAAALVVAGSRAQRSPEAVERIVELAQGNPFLMLELAGSATGSVPALVPTARDAIASRFIDLDSDSKVMLGRLAMAGDALDPAGIVALSDRSEEDTFALLDRALDNGVLIVEGARYLFRHDLVRQALIEGLAPHRRFAEHRDIALRLQTAGAEPGAIAHHWLAGGRPDDAAEWLLTAARRAIELGAFRDSITELDLLLENRPELGEALAMRAEALDALGDRSAPAAYAAAAHAAAAREADELRAKQALAMVKLGDPPGGLAVLEGVEPETVDGRLAHALALCGAAALGFGDPEVGAVKAAEARRLALASGDPAALTIASWANAAAAHARGDLRNSVEADLNDTHALPRLAVSVFDGQLCITQRLLYGARPYPDVIAFADSLAAEAERLGAVRGLAFAVTIRGEAKLLAGRLDEAEDDLTTGVRLHREIGAATGESFALQRRAEVALHRGDRQRARALLDEALARARESDVGFHLFDRIYGTWVLAADPGLALAAVEEAEAAVRGPIETCPGCRITLAVPAAIAAAQAGDIARADEWGREAEYLAGVVMRLPAWDAAVEEVRGHRARARGDARAASEHLQAAAAGFGAAGQPLDEARCTTMTAGVAEPAG